MKRVEEKANRVILLLLFIISGTRCYRASLNDCHSLYAIFNESLKGNCSKKAWTIVDTTGHVLNTTCSAYGAPAIRFETIEYWTTAKMPYVLRYDSEVGDFAYVGSGESLSSFEVDVEAVDACSGPVLENIRLSDGRSDRVELLFARGLVPNIVQFPPPTASFQVSVLIHSSPGRAVRSQVKPQRNITRVAEIYGHLEMDLSDQMWEGGLCATEPTASGIVGPVVLNLTVDYIASGTYTEGFGSEVKGMVQSFSKTVTALECGVVNIDTSAVTEPGAASAHFSLLMVLLIIGFSLLCVLILVLVGCVVYEKLGRHRRMEFSNLEKP